MYAIMRTDYSPNRRPADSLALHFNIRLRGTPSMDCSRSLAPRHQWRLIPPQNRATAERKRPLYGTPLHADPLLEVAIVIQVPRLQSSLPVPGLRPGRALAASCSKNLTPQRLPILTGPQCSAHPSTPRRRAFMYVRALAGSILAGRLRLSLLPSPKCRIRIRDRFTAQPRDSFAASARSSYIPACVERSASGHMCLRAPDAAHSFVQLLALKLRIAAACVFPILYYFPESGKHVARYTSAGIRSTVLAQGRFLPGTVHRTDVRTWSDNAPRQRKTTGVRYMETGEVISDLPSVHTYGVLTYWIRSELKESECKILIYIPVPCPLNLRVKVN